MGLLLRRRGFFVRINLCVQRAGMQFGAGTLVPSNLVSPAPLVAVQAGPGSRIAAEKARCRRHSLSHPRRVLLEGVVLWAQDGYAACSLALAEVPKNMEISISTGSGAGGEGEVM